MHLDSGLERQTLLRDKDFLNLSSSNVFRMEVCVLEYRGVCKGLSLWNRWVWSAMQGSLCQQGKPQQDKVRWATCSGGLEAPDASSGEV